MKKIKFVIFDLSEVLLTGIRDTGIALVEKLKITEDSANKKVWFRAEKPTPLLTPLVEEFFNGDISEDTYIKNVVKEYPELGDEEQLEKHIRENFREIEGTREIILKLKKLNYKLGLLSVHGKEWIDYCEKQFDYHKLFDVYMYSYEIKVPKPELLAFQKIIEELNALPEQCLFIDDSETNVKAAESLGMTGLIFTNSQDLRHKLKEVLPDF